MLPRFLPGPSERLALLARFPGVSREILSEVFQTPSALPAFHARLLDSFAAVPSRGGHGQFFTAAAVKNLFRFNPLATSRGSFSSALLQAFLGAALLDPDRRRGIAAAVALFSEMDSGWARTRPADVFQNSPYAAFSEEPTMETLRERYRKDRAAACREDPRLRTFYDAVESEIDRLRRNPGGLRAIRRRVEDAVLTCFASGREPGADLLKELAIAVDTPQSRDFLEIWNDFEIVFSSARELVRQAHLMGLSSGADAFFVPASRGERGKILLRAFSRWDAETEEGRNAAFGEIINRLIDLFHEARHGRDANGDLFPSFCRHDRLVFEARGLLEEHLIRVSLGEENFERTARRLGEPTIDFLIHFADWLYP